MKKILVLISFLLLLSGCSEKVYEIEETEDIVIKENELFVYSDFYLKDIIEIKNKDVELISDNYKIDTDKLGSVPIDLIYKLDNKKYDYKFNVEVVDKEAPLVFSGTNRTMYKDSEDDVCNAITFGDNYDGDLKCVIEGNYDIHKTGTYKLKYIISDSSNNTREVDVTLNVIEKPLSSGSSTPTNTKKTYFSDVYKNYKNDNNEIGIDVSKWQGSIDYEKAKAAGVSFVMMRIGVQGSQTRELSIDAFYKENIKKAHDAGLKVGIYLYSIALTKEEAEEHAKWVIKTLEGEKLELPIVFDWENWSKWNTYKISFHDINEIANTFMKTIKDNGYDSMLYSSKFYLETIWTNKHNYPVWLAHYTSKTSYQGKYVMWQLCNNGRVDGINGDVDIDILYH